MFSALNNGNLLEKTKSLIGPIEIFIFKKTKLFKP